MAVELSPSQSRLDKDTVQVMSGLNFILFVFTPSTATVLSPPPSVCPEDVFAVVGGGLTFSNVCKEIRSKIVLHGSTFSPFSNTPK